MWSYRTVICAIADGFSLAEEALRREHARSGIDALGETHLHPFARKGLEQSQSDVLREIHLPSTDRHLPGRNARDRADLVILPGGKKSIFDPVDAHKEALNASDTLFADVASPSQPGDDECDPGDALWIEIKSVPQFRYIDGVPVPNARYSHELLTGPRQDVIKLAADPLIRHAGVLVILFNEHREAGPHDLAACVRDMLDHDLPVGMPEIEQLPIQDRAGNAWCTLGLIPLRI